MSDLLARLIAAGTPAELVAEVAKHLARAEVVAETLESRRASDRDRQNRRRSREVTERHVTVRDDTDKKAPDKVSPQTPLQINPKNNPPISPHWLPADEWAAYAEMRRRIRKPMTDKAQQLAIAELERLRGEGHDPAAVLNWAVMNSYQGLFPPKATNQARAGPAPVVGL